MKALRITMACLLLSGTATWVGCKPAAKYEVDFTLHRLHRLPTGQIETSSVEHGYHRGAGDDMGDGPPGQSNGAGRFLLRVESVTHTTATFHVNFSDKTQKTFTIVPKVPRDDFAGDGSDGIHIVVDDIRIQSTAQ
jgi:hypothetical protein